MERIKINHLPGQTWNRLGMNDIEIEKYSFEKNLEGKIREEKEELPGQGIAYCDKDKQGGLQRGTESSFDREEKSDCGSALGDAFVELLEETHMAQVVSLVAEAGEQKTYRMEFGKTEGAACGKFDLLAKQNCEMTVFQYFDDRTAAEQTKDARSGIRNRIRAEKGAYIKLVQVFLGGEREEILNDIGAVLEENAELEVDQIFLGGKKTVSGVLAQLRGRKSSFTSNIAYDIGQDERLDLNLIAKHIGKKTEAQMDVKGVLREGAHKLLRATVDFIPGCSGSVGKENEEVLLMDEEVVNQTVPLILCGEEDVEGAHGASIGRINEEYLFYLKSRGIPEKQIYEMLANARIETVLGKIDDGETRERVMAALVEG